MKKRFLCLMTLLLTLLMAFGGCAGDTPEQSSSSAPVSVSQPEADSCTLSITCSSILENMDKLNPDKASAVPSDGVILKSVSFSLEEGDTALDLLKKAAGANDISVEEKDGYVRSIANLTESDCGDYSGWVYEVNGESPEVSCNEYVLKPGDQVEFQFIIFEM